MEWSKLDESTITELEKLLAAEPCSGAGVILRLAWRAGLMRDEIYALQWKQVDFERALLRLPDRDVPMDEDLMRCLRQWQTLCGQYSSYVIVSEHKRTHMQPESISRLARSALDRAGLTGVRLADLHYNYILRQSAQQGWQEALRTSGLSIATYRSRPRYKNARSSAKAKKASSPALPHREKNEREQLQAVLKENRLSPAGLALWLYCDTGLQYTEISSLTWEQVDLEHHLLHLADRDEPLSAELVSLLCEVLETRGPVGETHVLLSPHARKPIPRARLSNLTKELLAKNGLDPALPARLRSDGARESRRRRLLAYAARHGGISLKAAMELLGLSESAARELLTQLTAEGQLTRDHPVYRPVGAETTAAQRASRIRAALAEHGPCSARELSERLGTAHDPARAGADARARRDCKGGGYVPPRSPPELYAYPPLSIDHRAVFGRPEIFSFGYIDFLLPHRSSFGAAKSAGLPTDSCFTGVVARGLSLPVLYRRKHGWNLVGNDCNHGSHHRAPCPLRQRRRAKHGSLCRRCNDPRRRNLWRPLLPHFGHHHSLLLGRRVGPHCTCKNPASLCFDLCRNRLHRVSDHSPHVVIPLFFISYRTNSSFSAKALGEPPPLSGRFCFSASPPFQWHTHLCRPVP